MACYYCSECIKKLSGGVNPEHRDDVGMKKTLTFAMVEINGYFTAKGRCGNDHDASCRVYLKACPECNAVYMYDL